MHEADIPISHCHNQIWLLFCIKIDNSGLNNEWNTKVKNSVRKFSRCILMKVCIYNLCNLLNNRSQSYSTNHCKTILAVAHLVLKFYDCLSSVFTTLAVQSDQTVSLGMPIDQIWCSVKSMKIWPHVHNTAKMVEMEYMWWDRQGFSFAVWVIWLSRDTGHIEFCKI